jgi:hypothetical protein
VILSPEVVQLKSSGHFNLPPGMPFVPQFNLLDLILIIKLSEENKIIKFLIIQFFPPSSFYSKIPDPYSSLTMTTVYKVPDFLRYHTWFTVALIDLIRFVRFAQGYRSHVPSVPDPSLSFHS